MTRQKRRERNERQSPNIGEAFFVNAGVAFEDFSSVNPDFDSADPVGGVGFGEGIVNVGTEGMQGHAPFSIPFGAGNFGTAETSGAIDANAFGTHAHAGLHRPLHGAAIRDALFKLLGNIAGDKSGIQFRAAVFHHIDCTCMSSASNFEALRFS